jgi:hypothetical protein
MNNGEVTYLIQQGNYLKIGYTSNLKHRLKQYNTHNADYKLLSVINGDYERELHSMFENLKYRDEWFHYSDDIIKQFRFYKKKPIDKNLNKTRTPFSKLEKRNVIDFIMLCIKYSLRSPLDSNPFIVTWDCNFKKDLIDNNLLKKKHTILKLLLEKDLLTTRSRGVYYVNEEKCKLFINNFENGKQQ